MTREQLGHVARATGGPELVSAGLAEFTHSYTVFKAAGCNVTVASPKGGRGPADPQGFAFYAGDPDTQALVAKRPDGTSYVPATENTVALSALSDRDVGKFDIVFFVGGTGAMWDYINNTRIQAIVRSMWEGGKVVSAVCHGPIALAQASTAGSSFPGNEAQGCPPPFTPQNCSGPHMPTEYYAQGTFLLEDGVKKAGAVYVSTEQDWKMYYYRPHVVRHGRLVTGQNPGAGRETAQAAVDTLRLLKSKKNCPVWSQFADVFCTPVQHTASDPPVVCKTTGFIPKC
ncbi:hypothetical protein GPECTOR_39g419 [Gonium pectorale]|uniref:DJ-1/PfpI domain-containing protein n=1 Tax=Gonium pectorale TaxID=33097 RepID=A0A150GBH8_GONPE|nr:hypothetical protein GPECTOR_39g419 [Gonium pectorale]|eukprot:KXZ46925.1 hypothetical protein GPECTOR_39g419 [Gonium pectorale]